MSGNRETPDSVNPAQRFEQYQGKKPGRCCRETKTVPIRRWSEGLGQTKTHQDEKSFQTTKQDGIIGQPK